MQIQFGIETEIGITRGGSGEIDVVAESIALVRSAAGQGVRMRWDYEGEDPHWDARGFRVEELRQDTDEADYFAQDARRNLSFTEIKSDLVLRNGARFYNDHAHPEYCTPECSTLLEILQQDCAGDGVLMACAESLAAESGRPVYLYKNNTDFFGHSYGCHENYLIPRDLAWDALGAVMASFLATRQIFAGAGKFGHEQEDRFVGPGFQISQRSDFFSVYQSVDTMQKRPLINTRDEPHANPERFRRFHVIVGDANLSPFSNYLKVGTTALVLSALARGAPLDEFPRLADPLGSLRSISRDPSWKWRCRLADGREVSAVEVQRAYLETAERYAEADGGEWVDLLAAWDEILRDLEDDPLSTADRLDWSAKYRLIEQFRAADNLRPSDPILRSLDLAYHQLDRKEGLFFGLLEQESFRLPYPLKEIRAVDLQAPESTRAAVRGACVERFGSQVVSAQWESIRLRDGSKVIYLDLGDLFDGETIAAASEFIRQARRPADLLSLPFAKCV